VAPVVPLVEATPLQDAPEPSQDRRHLLLVVRAPPSPEVRRFLAFLASLAAARILEETGNLAVPLPEVR